MKRKKEIAILLTLLMSSFYGAAQANPYTEAITGSKDSYGTDIKTNNNNNYTYNFGADAKLKVDGENYAIGLASIVDIPNGNGDVNSITINGSLDIYLTNNIKNGAAYGIYVQNYNNRVIDRSGGGIISVISDKSDITVKEDTIAAGVSVAASTGNVVKIGNAQVIVEATNDKAYYSTAKGLEAEQDNTIEMGNGTIAVTADVTDGTGCATAYGISAAVTGKVDTKDVNIITTATGKNSTESWAVGILADSDSTSVTTGSRDITTTAISDNAAYADGIYINGNATVDKENGKITAIAQGEGTLEARGLRLKGNGASAELGIVDISAKTIGGEDNDNVKSYGILAQNGSKTNIEGGSITAKAYNSDGITENENSDVYAIFVEGKEEKTTTVNVNQGTSNEVVIDGEVIVYDNSAVNLNLNTANSKITGAIFDDVSSYSTNENVGTTLTLANGATWNNTASSNVTNLIMDNGIINQNTKRDIDIKIYSGNGNINFTAKDNDNNGVLNFANTGDVTIENAEIDSFVNLGVANNTINTLDSEKVEENLNAIASKITYNANNGNLGGKVTLKEGLITPEASGDLLFYEDTADGHTAGQGYVANVKQNSSTTTIDNIKNVAATAIVAWRQEDSTLSQRLGELRESDGGQGIWVRMSRGEFEYDGEYKNQYNFFQMGYDWAAGSWHYGAAVSHNDGQTTYTHGDGENRSTSLSLYGTWLGDKGHYVDIVLKQGRLSNDFDIYTEAGHTSGDYDAWGTSLSGEYGMKVDLDGGWYVTPQAQLTLMRIGGEDYTTNNGIKVNQDSLESAVGRVGFEVGKRISDSGSIYAKASLLHDFAGSADTYLSHKGLTNSYHQDIGDTWCEAGIGFNYKTSENSYVYADVVKTFGGDVETPWQWNAGMRWTF